MRTKQQNAAGDRGETSPGFVLMGRVVVGLMAVLLVVMPWSEQYSGLDNFPHGQDAEVSLLGFFMMLGLVLLLARSGHRAVGALLVVVFVFLSIAGGLGTLARECVPAYRQAAAWRPPLPDEARGAYNLPLKI